MASFLGAKGSVVSVISWLAIIMTALMATYWYTGKFDLNKILLERVENDLSNMRKMVDDACELSYYRADYNPQTEDGNLDINRTDICISTEKFSRCKQPLCELMLYSSPKHIELDKITFITVEKTTGIVFNEH